MIIGKSLVVIPARGGSKGVPGKNIKLLAGKPLIHYTIEAAREVFPDDQIIELLGRFQSAHSTDGKFNIVTFDPACREFNIIRIKCISNINRSYQVRSQFCLIKPEAH